MRSHARWITALAPLAGAALLAAPAAAQTIEGVDVSSALPTTVHVAVAGKSPAAVRSEIHGAATLVCRNAVRRTEIDTADFIGCARHARRSALQRYHAAAPAVAQTALLVSAR